MQITPLTDRPSRAGSPDWFTGDVTMTPLFGDAAPSRVAGALVRFAPGARTHWHTHPLGQVLIVTEGVGRVQTMGGPVRVIRAGDVVRFAPGENHWHGATPDHAMSHIAVHEAVDGSAVTWGQAVSGDDYAGPAT
ncbi:Cupin domain protein [Loktanella fryxellensis]|uniref:Cupin domain protein n=1 Tax=Loktanella fryxellensis TaxID=245187 RepID=A0A1H8A833_9RHOB|nr:cupin domain-containing protein [Loktanella fryxellensis]SEM66713.1 Cupin domain protein [Loktanella fryxellensis]